MQTVWENLVKEVGDISVDTGRTLQEQIAIEERKDKLRKLITITEKKARSEQQAKR